MGCGIGGYKLIIWPLDLIDVFKQNLSTILFSTRILLAQQLQTSTDRFLRRELLIALLALLLHQPLVRSNVLFTIQVNLHRVDIIVPLHLRLLVLLQLLLFLQRLLLSLAWPLLKVNAILLGSLLVDSMDVLLT